ncbi:MAG TPA: hypothetical protein DEV81_00490 [Cyanobacteria bacterium UBA11049]|nr:hypothetical protein [Cyanobacteria bacterium UBA11049]
MAKNNIQVNISSPHRRKVAQKHQNQMPQIGWKYLVWLILLAASGGIEFYCGHNTAIAAASSKIVDRIKNNSKSDTQRCKGEWHERTSSSPITTIQKNVTASKLKPRFSVCTQVAQSIPTTQSEPEENKLDVTQANSDPELGTLRVQPQKLQPPPAKKIGHLLGQVGYFQSNNIFSGVDPVDDGLISTGLTLLVAPDLSKKTSLVTAIDGRLIRYLDHSDVNYNQLRFRAGIRQQLTPRMYGEIGWYNQKLFSAKVGDRFLNENAVRLALQREDKINNRLTLSSMYELRLGFADPDSRSRIINSLSTDLTYHIQPHLKIGLGYQFALANFTQRDRDDNYHLILGSLTYETSRHSQFNLQTGVSFGGSSDPNIDFDNLFLSVSYTVNLGNF